MSFKTELTSEVDTLIAFELQGIQYLLAQKSRNFKVRECRRSINGTVYAIRLILARHCMNICLLSNASWVSLQSSTCPSAKPSIVPF